MRYRIPLLAFWILCLLRLTVAQDATEKPLYQPTGSEVTIAGTVIATGAIPKPRLIDTAADPVCGQVNARLRIEDLLVRDGKLQNAFVYVKSESLNGYRFAVPDTDVVLQHRNCHYSPHVLGIMVTQKLSLVNSYP